MAPAAKPGDNRNTVSLVALMQQSFAQTPV
jgi:hypothetical protein